MYFTYLYEEHEVN